MKVVVEGSLAEKVHNLEEAYKKMENLCGELLATIKLNVDNGAIQILGKEARENYDIMIDSFSTKYEEYSKFVE